jgi:hypothetical protein
MDPDPEGKTQGRDAKYECNPRHRRAANTPARCRSYTTRLPNAARCSRKRNERPGCQGHHRTDAPGRPSQPLLLFENRASALGSYERRHDSLQGHYDANDPQHKKNNAQPNVALFARFPPYGRDPDAGKYGSPGVVVEGFSSILARSSASVTSGQTESTRGPSQCGLGR